MAKKTKDTPAPRFVRAVHLELDCLNDQALNGYLLTAGARRVLGRIAPSIADPVLPRAWTLTGPYGTGKSSFAVFAAQLLAPKVAAGNTQARQTLKAGDEDLYEEIPAFSKQFRGLLPVAVTGSREPIQVGILRGLKNALTHHDGANCQSVVRKVSKLLSSEGDLADRDVLEVFTAAAEAVAGDSGNATGLFLIVDELGKLLEYAASNPARSDVYILQHLAELAARSAIPVFILTILHKDFSGYADRLSAHEKAEWEKVRGRFEDIVFEEPADEILRLVALARTSGGSDLFTSAGVSDKAVKQFGELADQAWKLHLAPAGMAKPEFVTLLKQCWPLHPLVAVLIGPVFRKLAQNERSVFSFLSSQEPHGLLDFLASERDALAVYGVDRIYDYLWNSIGEGLYAQRNGKKWAEVEGALERLPEATATAVSVLKMIGVIGAIGGTKNIQATPEVLKFGATNLVKPGEFSEAISFLERASVITARKYNGTFALWEGSDVDIDERVKVARDRADAATTPAALAARFVPLNPVVARRYSFETGTLRYFDVQFVEPTALLGEAGTPLQADGRILVVLPRNAEERAVVEKAVPDEALAKQRRILVAMPAESRDIDLCLRELACLEWVKANTPELAGDLTARRELRARVAEVQRHLDVLASNLLVPPTGEASTCEWFHGGRSVRMRSRRALNDYLSETCSKVFSKTPTILNELVNRKELSSQAAAARRNLIQSMIEKPGEPELGIEGFPPEKSIYLSVLSQHGMYKVVDGEWEFGSGSESDDPGMREVWKAIQDYFDSTEQKPLTVEGLFDLLRDQPYGVRNGPLPLLLCAALITNESDVALYEEGSFVPQLTIAVFERLMKSPSNFTVRRWKISSVRAVVFRQLAEMLGKSWATTKITKRNVLDVVRPLLRFIDQLPEYTRTTDQIGDQAKRVRAALLQTREADQLLFVELPRACEMKPIDPDSHLSDEKLKAFMSELRLALGELQRHYEITLAELKTSLAAAFGIDGASSAVRERLTARAGTLRDWVADPAIKNFIVRVSDATTDERSWIESVTSLLCERPPALWRDPDRAKFEVATARLARHFRHLESLAFDSNGATNGQTDAVRIGVTTRDGGDVEQVVHVGPEDKEKLDDAAERLLGALKAAGLNGHKNLALAAVARLAKSLLS